MNPIDHEAPGGGRTTTSNRWLAGMLLATALLASTVVPETASAEEQVSEGERLAKARGKGNCLACHAFDDGQLPGNIGPPLVYMKQRYPDRAALHRQIWDATERNPETVMPPFGRHRILSDREIDLIVDYLYTL